MKEEVVLVNQQDEVVGLMGKIEAHKKGLLHRAFSVFILNNKNEMLLQQRAPNKYHSPLLWTNACCSHPYENETYLAGANRRLQEEMGLKCHLNYAFDFIYNQPVGNGLTEHELDHVFIGQTNEEPQINPTEVAAYKWISLEELQASVKENPENYTIWFRIILKEYIDFLTKNQ